MANLWLIVANWMLARVWLFCGRGAPASALGGPDRHLTFFCEKVGPYSGIEPETSRLEVWRSVQLS